MSRVDEIEAAIDGLPPEEYRRIVQWFRVREQRRWDEQLDADSSAGKLDLVNSAHTWSLSPSCVGFHRVPEPRPRRVVRAQNGARYPAPRGAGPPPAMPVVVP